MPLMIESMNGVSLVISFTIGAFERIRARFALLGFKSWWVGFIVSLTTPTELSVMF